VTAAIEVGLMISLGFLAGQLFGWSATESLFVGGCLAISSTMLVSRAFSEQRLRGGFVDVVYAVLIFEDLLAILLLVVLTAVASGRGLGPTELAITMGRLAAFLGALLAVGLLVVPRFVAWIARAGREETLLIAAVAICFAMSALANAAGYSVALGAFLAGMLVAESGGVARGGAGDRAAAGHLRGDLLYLDRDAAGPGADRDALAAGGGAVGDGADRQGAGGELRLVLGGQRAAPVGARGHELGADRRVLVHHRGAGGPRWGRRGTSCCRWRSRCPA
jgi:hypothetical protein